jgi:hypothetical protein
VSTKRTTKKSAEPGARLYRSTGEVDEEALRRYVAREARAMRQLREKRHRDWIGVSDAKIQELAEALGRISRHQFRIMRPERPSAKLTKDMGLRVGDEVEFVTQRPGHEGEKARGTVIDVGDPRHPRWPVAMTQFGQTELPKSGVKLRHRSGR